MADCHAREIQLNLGSITYFVEKGSWRLEFPHGKVMLPLVEKRNFGSGDETKFVVRFALRKVLIMAKF